MRPLLLILQLLIFVLFAPLLASAGCQNDMECKGDRICVDGQCTSPRGGPPGHLPPKGTVGAVCSAAPSTALKPVLAPLTDACESLPYILERIADFAGVRNRPALFSTALEGRSPGYAAINADDSRIVVVSENLIGQLPEEKIWSTVYLAGHELGHHVEGHVYTGTGCSKRDELEASRFGARALRWLGASYTDVLAVARSMLSDNCHDAGKVLEDALLESYIEGGQLPNGVPYPYAPDAGEPGYEVSPCECDNDGDQRPTPTQRCSSGFAERLECRSRDISSKNCEGGKGETNPFNTSLRKVQVGTASREVCTVTQEKKWFDGYPVYPCGCYPRALVERTVRESRCSSGRYAFWSCPTFGKCDPRTEVSAEGLCASDWRIPLSIPCGAPAARAG